MQVGNPVAAVTSLEAPEGTPEGTMVMVILILVVAVTVTQAVMATRATLVVVMALLAQRHTIQIRITSQRGILFHTYHS